MLEIASVVIVLCIYGIIFYVSTFIVATTFSNGAPFVTTYEKTAKKVLDLAHISASTKVVDLGSGDGRMLFHFARTPASVIHGYEINPPTHTKDPKKNRIRRS